MKTAFKALPDLTQGGEDVDEWVERIGRIGAMMIHPAEFEADEIIEELEAYGVEAMTEKMAEVIRHKYTRDNIIHPVESGTWYINAVAHAWEVKR